VQEWIIYKEFRFEAAHTLPHHQGKCRRLHGHSWVGRIYIKGEKIQGSGAEQGMVMDFGAVKQYLQPLLDNYLDHYYLNDSLGLESPTSETIAQWLYHKLEILALPGLYAVEIHETCTSGCMYRKFES
jgi:6-pyruvoyltetrahydropterin/6-carboxytetrahydropterin synthase